MVELLRLSKAARDSVKIREPLHLRGLLESGLARLDEGNIVIAERIPVVPARLVERLPVRLRREHALAVALSGAANGADQSQSQSRDLANEKGQADPKADGATADKHGRQANRQPSHPGRSKLAR